MNKEEYEYLKELENCFVYLMDGQTESDIRYMTGLPEAVCEDIYNFYTQKVMTKSKLLPFHLAR